MRLPVTSMIVAVLLCVLPAGVSADSGITLYKKVGDAVVLKPGTASVTGPIINILWKDGGNIAMEWEGAEIDSKRHFKERGHLNTSTGAMTITGLTPEDSGLYTPEINNEIRSPTILKVIFPVPKPTVVESCNDEKTSCTLTCGGDTMDPELVTRRWKLGDKVTFSSKELHITKDVSLNISEFSCELENPVSQESSQPLPNPFNTRAVPVGKTMNISTGVTVFLCLLVAVVLLVSLHRCKTGMWFFQKTAMPWEADFWKNDRPQIATESNGTSAQEKGLTDEETPMA
ncbi:uncharacterized protein LOC115020622 [Cottoperca gobio]|uniref:Uncharacterized protein LOC115020622 n=1 Tax=Cottoperca gobio TaxID=56716 RepID=A0A6J2R878_COTGO|nr:uncharacterized protein LOC115020622 [Cottoperca gobio]